MAKKKLLSVEEAMNIVKSFNVKDLGKLGVRVELSGNDVIHVDHDPEKFLLNKITCEVQVIRQSRAVFIALAADNKTNWTLFVNKTGTVARLVNWKLNLVLPLYNQHKFADEANVWNYFIRVAREMKKALAF